MKYFLSSFIIVLLLLISGCSKDSPQSPQNKSTKNYEFSFTKGSVSGFFVDKVIAQIQNNFTNEESEYEERLAVGIKII